MPIKRSYADLGDACATAHGMELISEHWGYIVIRELFLGPKRFGELFDSARGITPAMLSTRLRELEHRGIITAKELELPARVKVYDLTEWGRDLEPIMHALGRWAQCSPLLPKDGGLTPDAAVLAMRTMAPRHPLNPPIQLQLRLSDSRGRREIAYEYVIDWGSDGFHADRGRLPRPGTRISIDATSWAGALFNGAAIPREAVQGDPAPLDRLIKSMSVAQP